MSKMISQPSDEIEIDENSTSLAQWLVATASNIGVEAADLAIKAVVEYDGEYGTELDVDSTVDDFIEVAERISEQVAAGLQASLTAYAVDFLSDDENQLGEDSVEVSDYVAALKDAVESSAVEWLTSSLYFYTHHMQMLAPHEQLLANAIAGVFVAELLAEDSEDEDDEGASESEDDDEQELLEEADEDEDVEDDENQ